MRRARFAIAAAAAVYASNGLAFAEWPTDPYQGRVHEPFYGTLTYKAHDLHQVIPGSVGHREAFILCNVDRDAKGSTPIRIDYLPPRKKDHGETLWGRQCTLIRDCATAIRAVLDKEDKVFRYVLLRLEDSKFVCEDGGPGASATKRN